MTCSIGLICYCSKTGTDVYQRNSLGPFSFSFCLFNRECRYKTSAWHRLGYIPDYENMSSATHSISRGGFIGKIRPCRNFHSCLKVLLNPLIDSQGKNHQFMLIFGLETKLPYVKYFFQLLMSWVMD